MNVARLRGLLGSLPHVVETLQWGENLVFWVGDKGLGGKMFALAPLDVNRNAGQAVLSFAAGPERFSSLLEREGFLPTPYLARAFWVAVKDWDSLTPAEWQEAVRAAHALVMERLPRRTVAALALPPARQQELIQEEIRRKATRAAAKRPSAQQSR